MSSNLESNPRPQRNSLLVTIGIMVLFSILLWSAEKFFDRNPLPAEVQEASAALKKKDIVQAREAIDKILKQHPKDPEMFALVCAVCQANGQNALSIEYARRGIQECKDATPAKRATLYTVLATTLAETGTPQAKEEALIWMNRSMELDPENPEVLNALGYTLADNNVELDRAQQLISKALNLVAKQPDAPQKRQYLSMIEDSYGWVLYRKGKYAESVDAMNQAIEDLMASKEDFPNADISASNGIKVYYYHLGAASRKAGRTEEARRALQIALKYDPDYPEARAEMAALPAAAAEGIGKPESSSAPPQKRLDVKPSPKTPVKPSSKETSRNIS